MQSHLPPHVAKGYTDPTGTFRKGYSCSEPSPLQVDLPGHRLTADASCLGHSAQTGLTAARANALQSLLKLCREQTAAKVKSKVEFLHSEQLPRALLRHRNRGSTPPPML